MWRPHNEFVTQQAFPDFHIAVCLLTHRGTISQKALRSPHWGHSGCSLTTSVSPRPAEHPWLAAPHRGQCSCVALGN